MQKITPVRKRAPLPEGVNAPHKFSAKYIAGAETEEETYVRSFLARLDLKEGGGYGASVYRGRALLEWYADTFQVPTSEESAQEPTLTLGECADILDYLTCSTATAPHGHDESIGHMLVMSWLEANVRRSANQGVQS